MQPSLPLLNSLFTVLLIPAILFLCSPVLAKQQPSDSPLTVEMQRSLKKAMSKARSMRGKNTLPLFTTIIEQADNVPKCIAIAAFTESSAYPLMEVRKQCLAKALTLCDSNNDLIEIALKSRQYEYFEITRQAINSLIESADTIAECYDLASQAQEVALNDVAHMAMLKAYPFVKTVPEALEFAKKAKLLGMDDLVRRTIKDLIDDENNAHELMVLLRNIDQLDVPDLQRYLFRKALDKANTVEQFHEIWDEARRYNQKDVYDLAAFRGRKLMLIQQIKNDQTEYRRQLQSWKTGLQKELARQDEQKIDNSSPVRQSPRQGGMQGSGF